MKSPLIRFHTKWKSSRSFPCSDPSPRPDTPGATGRTWLIPHATLGRRPSAVQMPMGLWHRRRRRPGARGSARDTGQECT
jgi:hypothetical protein